MPKAGGGGAEEEGRGQPEAPTTDDVDVDENEWEDETGMQEDDQGGPKSASELRKEWNNAIDTVRYLERRGGPGVPQAVLDSARAHRDNAERAWRAAKVPHPLGRRLRWAAADLEAALAKENLHREELEDFEAQTLRRRGELLERQRVDEERTARKRALLDQLREEAGPPKDDGGVGARAMAEIRRVRPTMWATRVALEGIQSEAGPMLERALENIPEGSQTWNDLQLVLSSITGVHGVLADALHNTDETDHYNMAQGDGEDADLEERDSLDAISLPGDSAEGTNGYTEERSLRERAENGEPPTRRRAIGERPGGPARWTKSRTGGEGNWQRIGESGTTGGGPQLCGAAAAAGHTGCPVPPAACADQRRLTEAAAREVAEQRNRIQEAEFRRAEEAAEQRRQLEHSYSPEQRAQAEELHAVQTAAAAASFGSPEAAEIARRTHAKRVQEVIKSAREKDLEFSQAELLAYTAEELEDWARRHI